MGKRVSALSVGLACLTSCADLAPSLLPSLSPYLPFTVHPDPKLKSRSAKVYIHRRGQWAVVYIIDLFLLGM